LQDNISGEIEDSKYIVPCKLPKPDPESIKEVIVRGNATTSSTLCFVFKNQFIQVSILDKFIAACIQRFEPFVHKKYEDLKFIQRGSICIKISCRWNLILCCRDNVIKMTLFNLIQPSRIESGTGYYIRYVMKEMLVRTLEITHQTHLQFDTYFHPNFDINSTARYATAEEIKTLQDDEELSCTCADEIRHFFTRKDYDVWFCMPTEMQVLYCFNRT